jgi:hypothetical protein
VKDLLSPSPLSGMSFILDDIGGYTSARTRSVGTETTGFAHFNYSVCTLTCMYSRDV